MMDCSETALSKKTLLPASLALLLFIYVTLRCLAQMSVTQVPRLTRVNNLFSMFVLKMLEKQALRCSLCVKRLMPQGRPEKEVESAPLFER